VIQVVKERFDIQFQNPATLLPHQPLPETLQRHVRRAPRSKPVRAVTEVLLVYRAQYHRHRSLQHLVFEARYADGTLFPIALGHVGSAYRRGPVLSRLEPLQQRPEVLLQTLLVGSAGLAVDSDCTVLSCATERLFQKLEVDVVGEA
jgi:hypothetical protein